MINKNTISEYELGMRVGTYSDEMLKDLLYSNYDGYIETIKIYRNRPLTIFSGFSPIVYQATICGLLRCYEQYTQARIFEDEDRFKMSDVIYKRSSISSYIKEHLDLKSMTEDDVQTKITIVCYLEHLRTMLLQGQLDKIHYHEIDRLESDTLMWGINPADKYAVLFVKENFELLRNNFEFRGNLNNLSLYSRIMLGHFVEVKMIRSIVGDVLQQLNEEEK